MNKTTKPASLDSTTRAHSERELKPLLIPWLNFKAHVRFTGPDKKKRTFYGNEHQVTYNQCLYGKVPSILLSRYKGYRDLVDFIEKTLKGKYLSAKIYTRVPETGEFDVLCREYFKGGLEKCADPDISEDECKILYYQVVNGRVLPQEEDPAAIDFKQEIENNLGGK